MAPLHSSSAARPFTFLRRSVHLLMLSGFLLTSAPLSSDAMNYFPVDLPLGRVWGTDCAEYPDVKQFLGIPFGMPTSGERRFSPPEAYNLSYPKDGLEAFRPPSACPQGLFGVSSDQSEDCLYLNVWAPASRPPPLHPDSSGEGPPLLPVRVFIHGGAFAFGSASEPNYNGCHMVHSTRTIQVNLQYRLGPLGFLGHPGTIHESGVTGNWGLLDQQMGLRWVQRNIAAFGGDPDRVLLFGESAGGMSVGYQVAMPSSAGLFHAAIGQSGAPFAIKNLHQAYAAGRDYVRRLRCEATDATSELACLRKRTVREMLNAVPPFNALYSSFVPAQHFFPIVDGKTLPQQPLDAIAAGHFNRVPYMLGTNRDEGSGFADANIRTWTDVHEFIWKVFPGAKAAEILSLYTGYSYRGSLYTPNTLLADFWTDVFMKCPTQRALTGAREWGVPVFQYLWTHTPSCPVFQGWNPMQGAAHFSEVPFVFGGKPCRLTEEEVDISHLFMRAWAAMATNGRPVLPFGQPWPQWNFKHQRLVVIGDSFEIRGDTDFISKCQKLDAAINRGSLHTVGAEEYRHVRHEGEGNELDAGYKASEWQVVQEWGRKADRRREAKERNEKSGLNTTSGVLRQWWGNAVRGVETLRSWNANVAAR
eukprot:TRINITY_DN13401_c0_g1_i1.p1 TRINITY_DN13401_c0_g1~~TRINITY_DN13401_c0_g1_i1.p1  ORF type:complete len:644 (+),score=86.64 TRINITY_DN13401_c0_g1_i1:501-2432(+)